MASNIKLTNSVGKTISIVGDDNITQDITYNLSKNMYTVDTVADLRGMTSVPEYVYASGYHTKNDGAFGSHFYRRATDIGQVDNSGTIIRTVNGVYELQYDGAVNVKWFGAKGDGITDDTLAIQSAINFSTHTLVPDGSKCLLTSSITIPDGPHTLEFGGGSGQLGAYPGSYFIKASTMTTPAILVGYSGTIINGGVVCQAGNSGDGIQLISGKCKLIQTYVTGAGNDGIRIGTDVSGGNCNSFYLENCTSQFNGRHGFYIHDITFNEANANVGLLLHPSAYNNTGDGIKIGHGFWNSIASALCQENAGWGLNLSGINNNSYPECRWTTVTGGDYNEGNALGAILDDSYFSSFFGLDFYCIPESSNTGIGGASRNIFIGSGTTLLDNITFPSPKVLSNDVYTLDAYEEGTFTPVVVGTATAGTATYAAVKGRFTRIGNTVSFVIAINFNSGTGVGSLRITGLPYTALNDSSLFQAVNIGAFSNLTTPTGTIPSAIIIPNTNAIAFYSSTVGSSGPMSTLAYDSSAELYLSGTYFV